MTEHEIQRLFVMWFRQTYRPVRIFAIPNGEYRVKSVAGRLKAEGVSAGVLDLFVPAWHLWIEMKTEKGKLSPEQIDWCAYFEACGYDVIIAYGYDDAVSQVKEIAARKCA